MALLSYKKTLGKHVVSHDKRKIVGFVTDMVIDYSNGSVLAFVIKKKWYQMKTVLLSEEYIMDVQQDIFLSKVDNIQKKGKYTSKAQTILEEGIRFMKSHVETESGEYLGIVTDYLFDTASLKLIQLEVELKLLQLFPFRSFYIHRSDVVDITKGKIIVRDRFVKEVVQGREKEEGSALQTGSPTMMKDGNKN